MNHKHTSKKTVDAPAPVAVAKTVTTVAHEDIQQLAYSFWVSRGFQGGSAHEDWLRAEQQLKGL
ncbi:MAG: DUF2934 domain-containing protein [Bryobacteraceae bacterium]